MNTRILTATAVLIGMVAGNVPVALASEHFDTVTINGVSASCGEQSLAFSGTATYSETTQHLVVALDGTQIFQDDEEPAMWTTTATTVGVGSHTLTATIYDHRDLEDPVATAQTAFTVSDCSSSSGSGGHDTDCCPGRDPEPKVKKAVAPLIKGASTSQRLPLKLKPLNEIFRKVYGRNPTLQEWNYWAHRLLTDKVEYDALYGAMQWHHLHGHTHH